MRGLNVRLSSPSAEDPEARGGAKETDTGSCTDKKENQIFLIYKEFYSGAVAKSYRMKGFLICEEMRKYFTIYEEAVSHI